MNSLHNCDVSKTQDFQKLFNDFYRMRQRSREFYQQFYNYFELHKSIDVKFENVLMYLHTSTLRYEPSFSSKLLATINPNMPIWDANVLSNLSIKPPGYSQKNRLNAIIKTYRSLGNWHSKYLNTQNAIDVMDVFDKIYPGIRITNVKKIDFVLWSLGYKKS